MQHAPVPHVAALADHDGVTVGAQHRPYQTLASAPIVTRPMLAADKLAWPITRRAVRPRRMPSRNGRRSPRIYPPLVTGSSATIRCASPSLAASKIAMPVLTWPRHGPAAISRPSASSLRSQAAWASKAARSAPLMVAMKSSRAGCMKTDPLAHAPILPLLRALGRHGAGCENATRARRQSERSQGRLVPGVGEPLGGTGQNPCKRRKPEAMASPRRCPERPFARAAGLSPVGVDARTERRIPRLADRTALHAQ